MNEQSSSRGAQASLPPLPHYVSTAPFDPYSVERTTAEQEKIYLASQWKLMALKFKRHRIAVLSAIVLGIMYAVDPGGGVPGALPAGHPQRAAHLCGAAAGPLLPQGRVHRAVRLCARLQARHEDPEAHLHRESGEAAEDPLLLPRRQIQLVGRRSRRSASDVPAGGRADVPARLRPARARHALAHPLWHAHLAHHRPHRCRGVDRAGRDPGRARRLLRRLGRRHRAARDRGGALDPASALVAGAGGDPASQLVADPDLFRHHHHSRPDRLDRTCARGAIAAAQPARRGFLRRRAADGRQSRSASSSAT